MFFLDLLKALITNNTKGKSLTVSWERKLDKTNDCKTIVCTLQFVFIIKYNTEFKDKCINVTMSLIEEQDANKISTFIEQFNNGKIKYD